MYFFHVKQPHYYIGNMNGINKRGIVILQYFHKNKKKKNDSQYTLFF